MAKFVVEVLKGVQTDILEESGAWPRFLKAVDASKVLAIEIKNGAALAGPVLRSLAWYRCLPAPDHHRSLSKYGVFVARDIRYASAPRNLLDVYFPACVLPHSCRATRNAASATRDDAAHVDGATLPVPVTGNTPTTNPNTNTEQHQSSVPTSKSAYRGTPLAPVIMFCHGGIWSTGDKWQFACLATRLAQAGILVVVIQYSLYPEAVADQMAVEVSDAITWTLQNVQAYGGDPNQVTVMGHSAGAHLTSLALLHRARLAWAAAQLPSANLNSNPPPASNTNRHPTAAQTLPASIQLPRTFTDVPPPSSHVKSPADRVPGNSMQLLLDLMDEAPACTHIPAASSQTSAASSQHQTASTQSTLVIANSPVASPHMPPSSRQWTPDSTETLPASTQLPLLPTRVLPASTQLPPNSTQLPSVSAHLPTVSAQPPPASTQQLPASIRMPACFVGMSGVYDLALQYETERLRKVHNISTLCRANGGPAGLVPNSPAILLAAAACQQDAITDTQAQPCQQAVLTNAQPPACQQAQAQARRADTPVGDTSVRRSQQNGHHSQGNTQHDRKQCVRGQLDQDILRTGPLAAGKGRQAEITSQTRIAPQNGGQTRIAPQSVGQTGVGHLAEMGHRTGMGHQTRTARQTGEQSQFKSRGLKDYYGLFELDGEAIPVRCGLHDPHAVIALRSELSVAAAEQLLPLEAVRKLPPFVVMSSCADHMVPWHEGAQLVNALEVCGVPARHLIYQNVCHNDFVFDWHPISATSKNCPRVGKVAREGDGRRVAGAREASAETCECNSTDQLQPFARDLVKIVRGGPAMLERLLKPHKPRSRM